MKPKRLYRELALKHHPDAAPNKMTEVMRDLNQLWQAVKDYVGRAHG